MLEVGWFTFAREYLQDYWAQRIVRHINPIAKRYTLKSSSRLKKKLILRKCSLYISLYAWMESKALLKSKKCDLWQKHQWASFLRALLTMWSSSDIFHTFWQVGPRILHPTPHQIARRRHIVCVWECVCMFVQTSPLDSEINPYPWRREGSYQKRTNLFYEILQ